MVRSKTIHIPIYFGYFRIIIADDFSEVKLKVDNELYNLQYYSAFVYTDHTKKNISRFTIVLKPKTTHSIIAHEVVHLVNALFLSRSMKLDEHNDEAQAYLTGWFVREIYKFVKPENVSLY